MIRALRRKFVLITMLLVSVVLLAVLAGICLYYAGSLRQESYRTLEQMLDRRHGDRGPSFQVGGKVPEGFGGAPAFVAAIDADGQATLLVSEHIEVDASELQDIAQAALGSGDDRGDLKKYDLRYLIKDRADGVKIAFMALSLEKSQLRNVFMVTALAVVGALIIFFIASVLLARWALRPVERAWKHQRRFVADASHELKTPLTVILANTEILKRHPEDQIADQMAWVTNTEEEARRMKGLVDDLLFLAKGDDAAVETSLSVVDFSNTVATAALSFEAVAFEQGLSLEMEVEQGITVQGNEPQLKQVVGILLDNAVKYGEVDSVILLRLKKRQGQAELSVYNQGEAIHPEDQKHLFERFYRSDPSRTEQGYGLGLSIAKTIVENHRGRVTVESGKKGTTFTVHIPVSLK